MKRFSAFLLLLFFASPLCAQTEVMQWVKQIKGYGLDAGYHIEIDQQQAIYVGGNFTGTPDFDPGPTTMNASAVFGSDGYLLKLDQNGNFLWVKLFSGNGNERVSNFKIDPIGNVYLIGSFDSTMDMDPGPAVNNFTSNGSADIFLSKLDAAGNLVWAKQLGGPAAESANSLVLDKDGFFYLAGRFDSVFDADPGPVLNTISPVTNGYFDFFIEKYDFSGNLIWVKHAGGPGNENMQSLALDNNKHVYFAGQFQDTVDLDPGPGLFQLSYWPNPTNSTVDAFFAKLDSNGNFLWAKQLAGNSNPGEHISGMQAGDSGHVFLAGYFSYTVDFDPGPGVFNLSSPPLSFGVNSDTYIAKYTPAGDFIWVKQFAGTHHTFTEDMILDSLGNVYFTGHFWDTTDFDPGPGVYLKHSTGNRDIFITKLNAAGDMQWTKCMGGALGDGAFSMAGDAWGNIFTTGYFRDSVDFDFNAGVYPLVESGNNFDGYIHKLAQCDVNTATSVSNNTLTALAQNSTFQWLNCTTGFTPIPGETNAVFTPLINGNYAVQVSVGNCIDTGACISISEIVGLPGMVHQADWIVYPNPNTGSLYLRIPLNATIEIQSMTGVPVYKKCLPAGKHSIDLQPLSVGLYTISLLAEDQVRRKTIFKQ